MKQILWSLLAIFVAVIVGGITVGIVEIPGYFIHPPPPGLSFNDMEAMKAHAAKAPPLAMAVVALAWAAGPFVGTLAACLIVRKKYMVHGLIIGTIFALLDASNFGMFPHPIWLIVAGIAFPFLASSAAAFIANRLFPPKACSHQPFDMRKKNMACK
jgi:hypothetical protein